MVTEKYGLAYDLSLFDEAAAPPQEETTRKIAHNVTEIAGVRNNKQSRYLAFRNITAAIICAAMSIVLIYSNAQLTEMAYDIRQAQTQIETLNNEAKHLSVEIDKKFDLRTIEQLAREQYGMQKAGTEQVTYLNSGAESHAMVLNQGIMSVKDKVLHQITLVVTSIQEYFNK